MSAAWMSNYGATHPRLDVGPAPKISTRTTEIECAVDGNKPSYLIAGIPQRFGDRARVPMNVAEDLSATGKARIVDGTEKLELL